jgi:hypothetical protein
MIIHSISHAQYRHTGPSVFLTRSPVHTVVIAAAAGTSDAVEGALATAVVAAVWCCKTKVAAVVVVRSSRSAGRGWMLTDGDWEGFGGKGCRAELVTRSVLTTANWRGQDPPL